jgi:heme/copper-type cytochrome/quinol oxidase subunit 3
MSEYVNRFDGSTVAANGRVIGDVLPESPARRRGRRKATRGVAPASAPRAERMADQRARFWCTSYVTAALILSAFLNGYANAAFVENKLAGWCMGVIIPVLVFTLFKAAGWLERQGNYPLAIAAAAFGTVLLFLSVADCQQALSMLTHTPAKWLSWAYAITIDFGLVSCELGAMGVFLRQKANQR